MSSSVLYMSMSLDGFITGPDDDAERGLGRGGDRLHDWLGDGGGDGVDGYWPSGPSAEIFDEMMATGAVLVGRRTFDYLAQSCLRAGLRDEHELHLIPVLLGGGRPLFGDLEGHVELEQTRVLDAPGVTHLRFRVAA